MNRAIATNEGGGRCPGGDAPGGPAAMVKKYFCARGSPGATSSKPMPRTGTDWIAASASCMASEQLISARFVGEPAPVRRSQSWRGCCAPPPFLNPGPSMTVCSLG
jgi:hypothetical protein